MQAWTSKSKATFRPQVRSNQMSFRLQSRGLCLGKCRVRPCSRCIQMNCIVRLYPRRSYSNESPQSSPSYLELKPSLNKGLGMFAATNIPAYTQIVSDPALLTIGPSEDLPEAYQQYSNLPPQIKDRFLRFHSFENPKRDQVLAGKLAARDIPAAQISEMVKVSSIFTSNAFNVEDGSAPGVLRRTMFPTISRINHSCIPNAHTNYSPHSGRMEAYSLADIPKGDEISISYFNLLLPRDQRQAKAAKWGFTCQCPACDIDSGSQQNKHEARRARVREIEADLFRVTNDPHVIVADVKGCVEQAREMVHLSLEHESLAPQLPIAYDYLASLQIVEFELSQNINLLEQITENLGLALAAEVNITGKDSLATQKRLSKIQVFGELRQKIESAKATGPAAR